MKQGKIALLTLLIAVLFGCSSAGTGKDDGPLAEGTLAITSLAGQYCVVGQLTILDSTGTAVTTIDMDDCIRTKTSYEVVLKPGSYTVAFNSGYACADTNPPADSGYLGCTFEGSDPNPFNITPGAKTPVALNFKFNYTDTSISVVFSAGSVTFTLNGTQDELCGPTACTTNQICAQRDGTAEQCYDTCTPTVDPGNMVPQTLNQGTCSSSYMCVPVITDAQNGTQVDLNTVQHICAIL